MSVNQLTHYHSLCVRGRRGPNLGVMSYEGQQHSCALKIPAWSCCRQCQSWILRLKKQFGIWFWIWKLPVECAIGVVMGSHRIFQNFQNLIPYCFFIEFKIWKVGRMHSYECHGKRDGAFGLELEEKWVIKLTHAKGIYTKAKKLWLFSSTLHRLSFFSYPRTRHSIMCFSSCFQDAANIGQQNFSLTFMSILHRAAQSFLLC
jgi:hypothetical protein